jgi:uncharacterized protein (DUF302 family)
MLIKHTSAKPVAEIEAALVEAAARHGFGVLGVHDLQATMQKKGVDYPNACRVIEVCNPQKAAAVLTANGSISTALPCRISVYEKPDGTVEIATLAPTALLGLFGNPELDPVAAEVETTLTAMMRESA